MYGSSTDIGDYSFNSNVLSISLSTQQNVSCNGLSDGSATFAIATIPLLSSYSYQLKNGSDQVVASGSGSNLILQIDELPADLYTMEITYHYLIGSDTEESMDFSISEPQPLNLGLDVTDIDCLHATGSILMQPSGGSGSFIYEVVGGLLNLTQSSNLIQNLGAGLYNVTVTDLNGCTTTQQGQVSQNTTPPSVQVNGNLNLGCNTSVSLSANTSSGITLSWETPDGHILGSLNGTSVEVDAPGTYTVTAVNTQSGCITTKSVTVTADVQAPDVNITGNLNLGCNPSIDLSANSGSGITFTWQTSGGHILGSTTGSTITVDAPGTYAVTAINLETGCLTTESVEVMATTDLPALDITGNLNLGCNTSVFLNANSSNGIALSWQTPDGHILGALNGKSVEVDVPGTYFVTALNLQTGCTSTDSVEVIADVNLPSIQITGNLTLGCNTSTQLTVTSTSGIGLTWMTPNGSIQGSTNGSSISANAPGEYIVVGTDLISGCTSSDTVTITTGIGIPNVTINGKLSLDCNGVTTLTTTVQNGLTYLWSTLEGNISGVNTGASITVDQPGTYILTVNDVLNGCSGSDTVIVKIDTGDGTNLTISGITEIGCSGIIELTAHVQGASSLEWTTINGLIDGSNTETTLQVSQPGTYIATATTAGGCIISDTVNITDSATPPTLSVTHELEMNCQSILTLSAETSPQNSLSWTTANGHILSDVNSPSIQVDQTGTYFVQVKDPATQCVAMDSIHVVAGNGILPALDLPASLDLGCQGSSTLVLDLKENPGLEIEWFKLNPDQELVGEGNSLLIEYTGTYLVIAKDPETGCQRNDTLHVTSSGLQATLAAEAPECASAENGSASITMTSGTQPYEYLWDNGQTTSTVDNLSSGTYHVKVTDATGCIGQYEIVVPFKESMKINVTRNLNEEGAYEIAVSVEGGIAPYQYLWSNGSTIPTPTLQPGLYTLTVTDEIGCEQVIQLNLDENGSNGEEQDFCQYNDLVINDCSQKVFFSAPQMDTTISYQAIQISGLASGSVFPLGETEVSYMIRFESGDCHICSFMVRVLPDDTQLEVRAPYCPEGNDGLARINAPLDDYCITWNDKLKQKGMEAVGLESGNYIACGVNEKGCFFVQDVLVPEPEAIILMDYLIVDAVKDNANGQIQITTIGGTYPNTYHWTGPDGFESDQEDLYLAIAGAYQLLVTDANGCSSFFEFTIGQSELSNAEEHALNEHTAVFPNPSSGHFTVKYDGYNSGSVTVELFDNLGHLIGSSQELGPYKNQIDLMVANEVPGIYYLRIRNEQASITRKITIAR